MQAQGLTERIEILVHSGATGATGQKRNDPGDWKVAFHRWARAVPKASARFERLSASIDAVTAIYEIRGRVAVNAQMRVMHQGRTFRIVGLTTEGNRPPEAAEMITLICSGMQ
ncbi:MAG: phage head closure protein [Paludibaculum sp.]